MLLGTLCWWESGGAVGAPHGAGDSEKWGVVGHLMVMGTQLRVLWHSLGRWGPGGAVGSLVVLETHRSGVLCDTPW